MPRRRLTSMEILERDHAKHTSPCCPKIPEFIDRVDAWSEIEGTYDVISDSKTQLNDMLLYYTTISYEIRRFISDSLTQKEYLSNLMTKENFEKLQFLLQRHEIQLNNRRSPKVSNLIQTLVDHNRGSKEMNQKIINHFNDRGGKIENYQLILSTEPHRIAGMSAYGKFSSCQDWILKKHGRSLHSYTHQAWSNLTDPTVGVAYIFEPRQPWQRALKRDMLARALVRVLPLPNGEVMVYFSRIYAKAPYGKYLEDSFSYFAEMNLPDNYHFINMNSMSPYSVKGKCDGEILAGSTKYKLSLPQPMKETPYNDHSNWMSFFRDYIDFYVPKYILNRKQVTENVPMASIV